MKSRIYIFSLLYFFSCAEAASQAPEVVLSTNASSAFTAGKNQWVRGGSVEHIECIFKDMQQPYHITTMPWLRARQEVRKGNIDGFFTALSIENADEYASLSAPLVLESWYWFWRADMPAPESWKTKFKSGAILGSQQADWFRQAGYPEPMTANNLPQLLKMLFSKRIDVILADKEDFEKAAAELLVEEDAYRDRFFRYMPLSVYFGKQFLAEHPAFITQFNQHIYACAPDAFQLSGSEIKIINSLIKPMMLEWSNLPAVTGALKAQNDRYKNTSVTEILVKDKAWQEEFRTGRFNYSASILASPLSKRLWELKENTQGLITEIILMGARGANVAVSNMTSDYWQGDEEKYLLTLNKSPDELFIESIYYDESTRTFQVSVSLPIYAEDKKTFIGAISLGVDVEKVLSLKQ